MSIIWKLGRRRSFITGPLDYPSRRLRGSLLSLPFLSGFLDRSGVFARVEENRLEEILVGVHGLLGEVLGETPAGLLSSSGLIDLLSPHIQEVVMLFWGYSSWYLLDDHSGSPPLSSLRGRTSPFPTVELWHHLWHHLLFAQSMVHPHIETKFNAQKTHS